MPCEESGDTIPSATEAFARIRRDAYIACVQSQRVIFPPENAPGLTLEDVAWFSGVDDYLLERDATNAVCERHQVLSPLSRPGTEETQLPLF
ncbi:hypothetical protein VRRI112168_00595 [Vreelandella rituensis]|uniref:Uncharacterized protein n=1 Tax=Vreelandella rituensis TaxID=2282306 RepID=A0A368U9B7_9GAMM|nr:hypothetical protein [Halomonas rituensis]RCV93808.1 hypothetical protein DU506_01230 [Halomonas rituensis]